MKWDGELSVEKWDRLMKIKRRGIRVEMSGNYSGGDFRTKSLYEIIKRRGIKCEKWDKIDKI